MTHLSVSFSSLFSDDDNAGSRYCASTNPPRTMRTRFSAEGGFVRLSHKCEPRLSTCLEKITSVMETKAVVSDMNGRNGDREKKARNGPPQPVDTHRDSEDSE